MCSGEEEDRQKTNQALNSSWALMPSAAGPLSAQLPNLSGGSAMDYSLTPHSSSSQTGTQPLAAEFALSGRPSTPEGKLKNVSSTGLAYGSLDPRITCSKFFCARSINFKLLCFFKSCFS